MGGSGEGSELSPPEPQGTAGSLTGGGRWRMWWVGAAQERHGGAGGAKVDLTP